MVVRGFDQLAGLNYAKTFNLAVKPTTLRIVPYVVVSRGWVIRELDMENAFVHCDLHEEVYMT